MGRVQPRDQYHVGNVVDDLDAAKVWYSTALGYHWCEEISVENVFVTSDKTINVPLRFTYSMEDPHIELIEAVPGTTFLASWPHAHHTGYWSSDLQADIDLLRATGAELEGQGYWPDGRGPIWAYLIPPVGCRIELVHDAARPSMEKWWSTGVRGG
jgi:hypothetical protein